jgi:hypothetical protein
MNTRKSTVKEKRQMNIQGGRAPKVGKVDPATPVEPEDPHADASRTAVKETSPKKSKQVMKLHIPAPVLPDSALINPTIKAVFADVEVLPLYRPRFNM